MTKHKNRWWPELDEIPDSMHDYIINGALNLDDAKLIMKYPKVLERFEERCHMASQVERYTNVAKAYERDSRRLRRPHHTRYNKKVIDAIIPRIGESKRILDPMAGTIERLSILENPINGWHQVWGVELEPEWVEDYKGFNPRLKQGDARDMHFFKDAFFDVVIVSPSYGNRDSDRTGEWWDNPDRKTYAGALGRNVSEGSLCVPFEDERYKIGHAVAWAESTRVLKVGGLFVLNIKNHIKAGQIVRCSQWHREMLRDGLGYNEIDDTSIPTKGRLSGENYDVRAENVEKIYLFMKTPRSDELWPVVKDQNKQEE